MDQIEELKERLRQAGIPLTESQQKALQIMETAVNTAVNVAEAVKWMPKYKAPRIAKAHKRRRAAASLRIAAAVWSGVISVAQIAAQPIPKYPRGAPTEIAVLGDDNGPPEIIQTGQK